MTGRTLAHYRIQEKIGAGGMGEVYRATDTKLGRDVAIKVLQPALAKDPERMARFEREARVLASLNHPNIAAIYGFEQVDGVSFLVLELAPGETLAGPLPVEETVGVCRQVIDAFEEAHEKGIIHRDLKPANVKITPEGKVKVLDFGLAKALSGEPASASSPTSPTLTVAATQSGVLLGTAAYMSPEQARGRPADKRADIWAFGCVLYELLAGKRAFEGENISDILAAVLKMEPDWGALPPATPPHLRLLLSRCLEKDPRRRLRDIADARLELETPFEPVAGPAAAPRQGGWRRWIPWSIAASLAIAAAVLGVALWRARSAPRPVTRSTLLLPAGDRLAFLNQPPLALSPDGTRLVYSAFRSGRVQLFLRHLDRLGEVPISGTEEGRAPFFSPDGEWIGFFAGGKLKKTLLSGGAPQTVCDAPSDRGGAWGADDTIVLVPIAAGAGLARVPAGGGIPQNLITPGPKDQSYRWPQFLPGGKAILFTMYNGTPDDSSIAVLQIDSGQHQVLFTGGSYGRYVPTGHIVYARGGGGIMAVAFDPAGLRITGRQFPILEGVATEPGGSAALAVSEAGSLVYATGRFQTAVERTLVWVDRKGEANPVSATRRGYYNPRLSPDGRQIAVSIVDPANWDVWIHDLARDTLTRFTTDPVIDGSPVWTPDGKRIAFRRTGAGLFWKPADGSGAEDALAKLERPPVPTSWSPDGKWLAFDQPGSAVDIFLLSMDGERKVRPFLETQFNEWGARVSPDGRWIAYTSNESGRNEVYVQPFPGPGGRSQVSTEGGSEPVWSRAGGEMFYRNGDKMMAVDVNSRGASFVAAKPRLLFEGQYFAFPGYSNYDISPDGRRFLMIKESGSGDAAAVQVNLITNWFEELNGRK